MSLGQNKLPIDLHKLVNWKLSKHTIWLNYTYHTFLATQKTGTQQRGLSVTAVMFLIPEALVLTQLPEIDLGP